MKNLLHLRKMACLALFSIMLTLTTCQRTVEPSLSDEITGVYDVSSWCINNDTLNGVRFVQSCSGTYEAVLLVKKVDDNQIRVTARRYAMYKDEYLYFNQFSLRDKNEYEMIVSDSLGMPIGSYYKKGRTLLFTTRIPKSKLYYMASQKRPD